MAWPPALVKPFGTTGYTPPAGAKVSRRKSRQRASGHARLRRGPPTVIMQGRPTVAKGRRPSEALSSPSSVAPARPHDGRRRFLVPKVSRFAAAADPGSSKWSRAAKSWGSAIGNLTQNSIRRWCWSMASRVRRVRLHARSCRRAFAAGFNAIRLNQRNCGGTERSHAHALQFRALRRFLRCPSELIEGTRCRKFSLPGTRWAGIWY